MPILSHDFSLNAAQASLSLSISTGLMAIGMLVTGPISDAVGRNPVLTMASPVAVILPGMVVFTFGFYGAHSVASS